MKFLTVLLGCFAVLLVCDGAPSVEEFDKLKEILENFRSEDINSLLNFYKEAENVNKNYRKLVQNDLENFIEYVRESANEIDNFNADNKRSSQVLKTTAELLTKAYESANDFYQKWEPLEEEVNAKREDDQVAVVKEITTWSLEQINSVYEETFGNKTAVSQAEEIFDEIINRYYMFLEDCDDDTEENIQYVETKLKKLIRQNVQVVENVHQQVERNCLQSDRDSNESKAVKSCKQSVCRSQNQLQKIPKALERPFAELVNFLNSISCYNKIGNAFEMEKESIRILLRNIINNANGNSAESGSSTPAYRSDTTNSVDEDSDESDSDSDESSLSENEDYSQWIEYDIIDFISDSDSDSSEEDDDHDENAIDFCNLE